VGARITPVLAAGQYIGGLARVIHRDEDDVMSVGPNVDGAVGDYEAVDFGR